MIMINQSINSAIYQYIAGLILGLRPANENAISHWLGVNLESALCRMYVVLYLCELFGHIFLLYYCGNLI